MTMTTTPPPAPVPPPAPLDAVRTLADLLEQLGDVPPDRVLFRPTPGTATERDLLELEDRKEGLYELVDGTLVQKPPGFRESILAVTLGSRLLEFVHSRNLGLVAGADATMRLLPGLVRIPDVSYASWGRFPDGRIPEEPIPDLVPDIAVEILSKSNTNKEMARKRREYFAAGVRLVWEVDPRARLAMVYTAPESCQTLDESQTLDGGEVLPGFALPLSEFFADLDRRAPR